MEYAIIVAGGSGSRMGIETPKQFLTIAGLPILMHTIQQFYSYSSHIKIIVVLPAHQIESWKQLCQIHRFTVPIEVVAGGQTRFQSVRNGLSVIPPTGGEVAIHDGVRPFVPLSVIAESFRVTREQGNAVAAVALKDSVRQVFAQGITQSVNRNHFRLIQTPQTFRLSELKEAFQQSESELFTDDATVMEAAGHVIQLIEGDYRNVKITTPDDLQWAEFFVQMMREK
jgi:2-C-methyl-D-erythritol 4-phosphate cytidylyltransferase